MPFTHPARPYTRADIESLDRNQTGVYGIFRGGTCIYVGMGDIRDRLLAHFNGDNPCITRQAPNQWAGELVNPPDNRERALIIELNPACNQRVG